MAVENVEVTGVSYFKGDIDSNHIDSGKVFIKEMLDFTTGRAAGYSSQPYSLADAAEAKALMHNTFPLQCAVEFVRVTNGSKSKNIVQKLRPITQQSTKS